MYNITSYVILQALINFNVNIPSMYHNYMIKYEANIHVFHVAKGKYSIHNL
jgi:hypothetical protein